MTTKTDGGAGVVQAAPVENAINHDITKQLLGTVLSTRMIQDMGAIFSNRSGISIKNIAHLVLLMSLDEIKVIVASSIKTVKTYIVTHGTNVFSFTSIASLLRFIRSVIVWTFRQLTLYSLRKYIKPDLLLTTPLTTIQADGSCAIINFEPTVPLMQSLVAYIKSHPSECSLSVSNQSTVKVMNLEESMLSELWESVVIRFANYTLRISTPITMSFKRKQGHEAVLDSFSPVIVSQSDVKRLTDLLPCGEIKKFIRETVDRFTDVSREYKVQIPGVPHDKHKYDLNLMITKSVNAELAIAYMYKKAFPNIDMNICHYEYALLQIFFKIYGIDNRLRIDSYKLFNHIIHISSEDGKAIIDLTSRDNYLCDVLKSALHDIEIPFPILPTDEVQMYREGVLPLSNGRKDKPSTAARVSVSCTSQSLSCKAMSEEFDAFIAHLGTYTNLTVRKNIKIYNIRIERKENEVEIPNPAYKEWKARTTKSKSEETELKADGVEDEKKDDDSKEPKKSKKAKRAAAARFGGGGKWGGGWYGESSYFYDPAPAEHILKTEISKSVVVDLVNEKSKPLNTLYMRKNDMFKLKNCVEAFADRQELLSDLGLPNKLGILLYGKPGTGKSSAIIAVATHLKKDVYYVHLNCVQTNDELQMIFDHVNKQCLNGGIIIFEDIDAMTTVVHKRQTSPNDSFSTDAGSGSEKSVSLVDIVNQQDSQLTLEYFLNVLQGSLTQDGTIFMATTNHLETLDPAFYRDGRFDVRIEMKMCDSYQINTIYSQLLRRPIPAELLERIAEDKYTPANLIFHIKPYMFGDYTDEEILAPFLH